jgi:hypothetical protein
MKNFLFLSVMVFFAACKSKAKTEITSRPTANTQQTVYKGVTNDSCAIEMAFGSYGAGIDGKALNEVIAKINEKKLKYSSKNIGREGETRLCMPLTEIKGKEKADFIERLKKIAKEGQLVSLSIR